MFREEIITIGILFLPLVCSTPALSQTTWFKYEGNPVLDVGPPGAWDDDFIQIDRVIIQDSIYRMWYGGGWRKSRIGHATSRDGVRWTKHRTNPLIEAEPRSWEKHELFQGYVILTGTGYKMWYTAGDLTTYRIGYASSPDGIFWKKHRGNPVLDLGPRGSWDEGRLMMPSVIGPDSSGGYKIWFIGPTPDIKIGYATATDETSWTKYPGNPVFWDEDAATRPRVIYDGRLYEMWYRARWNDGVLRYAISPDGMQWTKSADDPALGRGPDGTWDDVALTPGDIIFDGNIYHMWYNGDDGSNKWRGGYAVSPKGMNLSISYANEYVTPRTGTVRIAARVTDPANLSFSAKIKASGEFEQKPEEAFGLQGLRQVGLVELFDDGMHGDSLAGDGLFVNTWVPTEEKLYFVDLNLRLQSRDTLTFEMHKAAVFTSIGPVKLERLSFLGDSTANPGDTVLIKLALRNHGSSTTARSVTASLSSTDPSITSITEVSSSHSNILPGETASTNGYHRLHINPYSPLETDVAINVTISCWGIPLWYDTFTLRVIPPWWRTTWAYVLYALLGLGSVAGTVRYVERRKLRRRIEQLEREQALEKERTRISQDMHDEVGATLTEIAILSELAKKKTDEAGNHVQQISERAADVIDNIGEIIWAMNPKNDSLDNLIAHLRRYAVEHLSLAHINCKFSAPESIPPYELSAEARRNLFLVVKEALHNVVKHSAATEVVITVHIGDGRIEILIKDNGKGFLLNNKNTESGNGLGNMGKRISDIGGTFKIESEPSRGTWIAIAGKMASPGERKG